MSCTDDESLKEVAYRNGIDMVLASIAQEHAVWLMSTQQTIGSAYEEPKCSWRSRMYFKRVDA